MRILGLSFVLAAIFCSHAIAQDQPVASAAPAPQQAVFRTWIEFCPLRLVPADCDLFSAPRWFEMSDRQPNAFAPAIRAAELRLFRALPQGEYMKLEQFPVGKSMGQGTHIFFPCENNGHDPYEGYDDTAAEKRGSCLR